MFIYVACTKFVYYINDYSQNIYTTLFANFYNFLLFLGTNFRNLRGLSEKIQNLFFAPSAMNHASVKINTFFGYNSNHRY